MITKTAIDIIESGAYKMLPTTVSLVSWIPGMSSEIDGAIIIKINAIIIRIGRILYFYSNFFLNYIYIYIFYAMKLNIENALNWKFLT